MAITRIVIGCVAVLCCVGESAAHAQGGPPIVTKAVQPVKANAGDTVSFCVGIFSVTTLTYQWSKDGVCVQGCDSGSTSASCLSLPSVQTNQAGRYAVRVINGVGSAESSATLDIAPQILSQPQTVHVTLGASASFSSNLNCSCGIDGGFTSDSYEWFKDSVSLGLCSALSGCSISSYSCSACPSGNGCQTVNLTLGTAQLNDVGNYQVRIQNGAGTTTSNAAGLFVACPSPGQIACSNQCLIAQTDSANCGSCGHACASGEGCALASCVVPVPPYALAMSVLPLGGTRFTFKGTPGARYGAQATSDLIHWQTIASLIADASGDCLYVDSTAASSRYYRAFAVVVP